MQLISVSLHDLQSRMAASPTDWIQYPDESFTQDNATRYYGLRRRSSQTGSETVGRGRRQIAETRRTLGKKDAQSSVLGARSLRLTILAARRCAFHSSFSSR